MVYAQEVLFLYPKKSSRGDRALEIGPGKGHITRALLGRCGRVMAVEIDPKRYATHALFIISAVRTFTRCRRWAPCCCT